jgi:hypothetical protein
LNYVSDHDLMWRDVCTWFVAEVANFVKKHPDIYVHVIGPIYRGNDARLPPLIPSIHKKLIGDFLKTLPKATNSGGLPGKCLPDRGAKADLQRRFRRTGRSATFENGSGKV